MKLFVYGTLQRGHRLNRVLQDAGAVFECKATTVKHYSMLFGGQQHEPGMFPVVLNPINGSPVGPIVGEVYNLPEDHDWRELDRIESAYDRTLISNDGEPVYMYVGKPNYWRRDSKSFTRPHIDGNIYWMLP